MSKNRRLQIVPVRNGVALTRPWSFFAQGDEFYAASQYFMDGARAKISFHSSGIWHLRMSTMEKRLLSNMPPEGNWTHAVHIHTMIPHGATRPKDPLSDRVVKVEVPPDHKMRVDVYVSRGAVETNAEGLPVYPLEHNPEMLVWTDQLRSGNTLLYTCQVQVMTAHDRKLLRSIFAQMPNLRYTAPVNTDNVYSEFTMLSTRPDSWNAVITVPIPKSYHHGPQPPNPNTVFSID